jgi:hypothetical protein
MKLLEDEDAGKTISELMQAASSKLSVMLTERVGGKIQADLPLQKEAQSNQNASTALQPGLYNLLTNMSAV